MISSDGKMPTRFCINPWRGIVVFGMIQLVGCGCDPSQPTAQDRPPERPIFREVAAQTGLGFHHFTGFTGEYFIVEIMGSGVALLDYDGDGDLDVYLLQGKVLDPAKSLKEAVFPVPRRHWPGARLFRNELIPTGELRFVDVTDKAGLNYQGYGMGAAVGDYDNDGDPDLYVTGFGSNAFYKNNGNGTFTDITRTAEVDDRGWSTSAAFVDYDNDGDLDLFFTNYIDFTVKNNKACHWPTGLRDYCPPTYYRPVLDRLFRNEGQDNFRDVSELAGIRAAFGNGLGVTCADFNADGWMDIYVANDETANQLWRSKGDGTFEDVALMSGAAYNADGQAEAGMGVTAGDFDGDGDEDLFLTHLTQQTNTLYLNDGSGEFRDASNRFGLGSVSAAYTGFGSRWFDFDHDGWLDLFVANGSIIAIKSLRDSPYPYQQKNQLFRGFGPARFEEVTARAGSALESAEVSRGAAFGDIDRDGDIDIVVSNNNGAVRLLLNEVGSQRHWLQLRLRGEVSNRSGIGARVALLRKGSPPLWRGVQRDGSYLSSSQVEVHFGLGDDAATSAVEGVGVVWPSGRREVWWDIAPDGLAKLHEGRGESWKAEEHD